MKTMATIKQSCQEKKRERESRRTNGSACKEILVFSCFAYIKSYHACQHLSQYQVVCRKTYYVDDIHRYRSGEGQKKESNAYKSQIGALKLFIPC